MHIPEKLAERLKLLDIDQNIYNSRTRKCILSGEKLNLEKVPWYPHAYFIPEGFETDEMIFDPVSLVPCLALDPKPGERILDMCAAPGTKTYIMSFMTGNEANITANDIDGKRVMRLSANIKKYEINASILNKSGRTIEGSFGKILIDAPCSGEGMVNKNEKLFEHWSEKRVRFLSKKQKKLISRGFEILEPEGTLVYSTCTFAPEENEAVVDFLLEKHDNVSVAEMNIPIPHTNGMMSWNGKEFDARVSKCMRILPGETGGFFVARIRKA